MKTTTIACLIVACMLPLTAQDVDTADIKKDLRILEKILSTSFDSGEDSLLRHTRRTSDKLRPHDINTLYLHGQGVLIEMDVDSNGFHFRHFSSDGVIAPAVPLAPVPEIAQVMWVGPENEGEEERLVFIEQMEEANEEMEIAITQIYENFSEISSSDLDLSRELRLEMREIREDQRRALQDLRRKRREMNEKLRKDKTLTEDERENMLAQAKKQQEEIKAKMDRYQAKVKKAQEESQARWNTKLNEFESGLMDVLCDYGGSLRSLPDNQFVTVVLRGAARNQASSDTVYVWKKSDLIACRDGKINKDQLKAKSRNYNF